MKKILLIGIMFMFLNVGVFPIINACFINVHKPFDAAKSIVEPHFVDIIIREYNGDGTYTEMKKKVSMDILENLRKSKHFDLLLFKKYGLIPKNVNMQKYKHNLQQLQKKLGLSREILVGKTNIPGDSNLLFNTFCEVDLKNFGVAIPLPIFNLAIGLSAITGPINYYLYNKLHKQFTSFDLVDTYFFCGLAMIGILETKGLLGEKKGVLWDMGWCTLIGFSGICVYGPINFFEFPPDGGGPITVLWYKGYALAVAAFPALTPQDF